MKNFFSFEDDPNDKKRLEKNKQTAFRNNVLFEPWEKREFPDLWANPNSNDSKDKEDDKFNFFGW